MQVSSSALSGIGAAQGRAVVKASLPLVSEVFQDLFDLIIRFHVIAVDVSEFQHGVGRRIGLQSPLPNPKILPPTIVQVISSSSASIMQYQT